jgi:hypothetical protein
MNHDRLERGDMVRFRYEGETYEGSVESAGPTRVHIRSADRGVYVDPEDVLGIVKKLPENGVPVMGERFRFSGGLGQRR